MYREIVVPIDDASTGFEAVPTAAELSRRAGVALAVLSLVGRGSPAGSDPAVVERRLAEVDRGRVGTVVHRHERSRSAIVEYADAVDRLICMAWGGGNHLLHPIRSHATERVASHSAHPVLTVGRGCRPDRRTGIRRLVVPLDGSRAGEHALDVATLWAMAFDLELELVQVHHPEHHPLPAAIGDRSPTTSDVLECASVRRRAHEVARTGVAVTYDVLHSRHRNPAAALMGHARAIAGAVLVVSTEGHLGLRSTAPANVAHRLVARAPVPVLVAHSGDVDELPAQEFLPRSPDRATTDDDGDRPLPRVVGPVA
jgi:nucleotide-binding universal stress UspA family protein